MTEGNSPFRVILKSPKGLATRRATQGLLELRKNVNVRWAEDMSSKSKEGDKAAGKSVEKEDEGDAISKKEVISGGELTGKFEWVCDVEASSQVDLELVYEVTAPQDTRWQQM